MSAPAMAAAPAAPDCSNPGINVSNPQCPGAPGPVVHAGKPDNPNPGNANPGNAGAGNNAGGNVNAAPGNNNAGGNNGNVGPGNNNAGGNNGNVGPGNNNAGGNNAAGNNGNNGGGNNNANGPAGNNGTVKIHDAVGGYDPNPNNPANDPHVSCTFVTDYFGFDAQQPVTPHFFGQAPTAGGELQFTLVRTVVGGVTTSGNGATSPATITLDNDGNGNSGTFQDGYQVWTTDASYLLTQLGAPQAQQGYHIRLDLDTTPAPGGQKHKVFWIDCGASNTPGGGVAGTTLSTLNVCKNAVSGMPGVQPRFSFSVTNGTPGSFSVQAGGACETVTPDTNAQSVTVTEDAASGYVLHSITVAPAALGTISGRSATIDVTQGTSHPTVIVTYTNAVNNNNSGGGGNNGGQNNNGGGTVLPGGGVTLPVTVPPVGTPPKVTPPVGTPPKVTPPVGLPVVVPAKVVNNRPATEVLGEKFTRSAPTQVAANQVAASQAGTLPFTGASHTGDLLSSGLGALLGGALLMIAGRRRRRTT